MKSVVLQVLARVFGEGVKSSFSPIFDPAFAPGFSLNLALPTPSSPPQSDGSVQEWLEVGKAGMIHPNVFESVDYDSDIYTGFILELSLDLLDGFKTTPL
jgi:phenylalanyl-tRNA synthetase alpha chain